MRTLWTTAVIFGLVTVAAAAAQGQDDQLRAPLPSRAIPLIEQVRAPELSPSDPAGREQELAEWIEEFDIIHVELLTVGLNRQFALNRIGEKSKGCG